MSLKHCIKHYKPQKWTLKNFFVSIFFKFVHPCLFLYLAVLFITSFSFLSSYFYVSFNLNFYKLRDTAATFGDNCSLQGWKTINFIQYFGGAVLFGGSLLLLSCGNNWRVCGGGGINQPYSKLCFYKEYFFNPSILTLNFVQSHNPDGYFSHPTSCS